MRLVFMGTPDFSVATLASLRPSWALATCDRMISSCSDLRRSIASRTCLCPAAVASSSRCVNEESVFIFELSMRCGLDVATQSQVGGLHPPLCTTLYVSLSVCARTYQTAESGSVYRTTRAHSSAAQPCMRWNARWRTPS